MKLNVLPTRVGMVRCRSVGWWSRSSSPYLRGDGPIANWPAGAIEEFSPPAWGWSAKAVPVGEPVRVLPTPVGMVRQYQRPCRMTNSSPHPRGDGPKADFQPGFKIRFSPPRGDGPPTEGRGIPVNEFSPPAWGWSEWHMRHHPDLGVLPTRVGMVRPSCSESRSTTPSPHPRGDGPFVAVMRVNAKKFSLPAWDDPIPPAICGR